MGITGVAIACALVGIASVLACYTVWKRELTAESSTQRDARRFIAIGGAFLNTFFTLLIAAELFPQLLLGLGD